MVKEKTFSKERERLNELVLNNCNLETKRFFNLDNKVYNEGALSKKTKELLGLVSSFVLRCDDCIEYHLIQCDKDGVNDDEIVEALSIGLVVGGSITVPHLRKAYEKWMELKEER
ncbi:MAG: carboxymuconolactone decarboxylase family protein [Thermoplasmatota archaeon]